MSNLYRDELQIAGWNTANDWRRLRKRLVLGGDEKIWTLAFNEYFRKRLELRYLNPIKTLQDNDTYRGEGFSIVAIQCTLIEFLESTVQGTNFRLPQKGHKLLEFEYSSSKAMFLAFLSKEMPFSNVFDEKSALDFYTGVRCGLLHEARTKDDWTISAKSSSGSIANVRERIVYRNNFQAALLEFVDIYGQRLRRDRRVQAAFIRKFDSLTT
jgi:hypothetical protein